MMDPVINNTINTALELNNQQNLQVNNGTDTTEQANGQVGDGKYLNDLVTITEAANRKTDNEKGQTNKANVSSAQDLFGATGVIAVDEDKNVVVRFYDQKGKMIDQYPPEDYLMMMKQLGQVAQNLFHKEA